MEQLIVTHYAVNLTDYHNLVANSPFHPVKLMFNQMLEESLVTCERGKGDGKAIRVKRDIPQKQWDDIMQITREGLGNLPAHHRNLFRIYESKTGKGSWRRI